MPDVFYRFVRTIATGHGGRLSVAMVLRGGLFGAGIG